MDDKTKEAYAEYVKKDKDAMQELRELPKGCTSADIQQLYDKASKAFKEYRSKIER